MVLIFELYVVSYFCSRRDWRKFAEIKLNSFVCLLGRDGLTHNMLDNIHALWKRRRVCKIKCKGVCTVDMDNVRQQLEVGFFAATPPSLCFLNSVKHACAVNGLS